MALTSDATPTRPYADAYATKPSASSRKNKLQRKLHLIVGPSPPTSQRLCQFWATVSCGHFSANYSDNNTAKAAFKTLTEMVRSFTKMHSLLQTSNFIIKIT